MRFFFFLILFSQFVELTYSSKSSVAALYSGEKGGEGQGAKQHNKQQPKGPHLVQIKHKYKTINKYKTVGVPSR